MKAGAADFVTKPWDNSQLLRSIETVLTLGRGVGEAEEKGPAPTRDQLDAANDFGAVIGDEPRMVRILELVGRIAPTDATVLINSWITMRS